MPETVKLMRGRPYYTPMPRVLAHSDHCEWHFEQYPNECTCGVGAPVPDWQQYGLWMWETHGGWELSLCGGKNA